MNSVLERLRKHKRAAASGLLPLLAAVWLTSAGACAAMPAADGEITAAARAKDGAGRHEHSTPAHGDHAAHARDVHATQAEGPGAHDPGTSGGEPREHGACPHCPAESGAPAESEHVACVAIDDASDAHRAPASAWDAKAPAVTILFGDLLSLELAPDSVVDRYGGIFRSAVALHLCNCVFLI